MTSGLGWQAAAGQLGESAKSAKVIWEAFIVGVAARVAGYRVFAVQTASSGWFASLGSRISLPRAAENRLVLLQQRALRN